MAVTETNEVTNIQNIEYGAADQNNKPMGRGYKLRKREKNISYKKFMWKLIFKIYKLYCKHHIDITVVVSISIFN